MKPSTILIPAAQTDPVAAGEHFDLLVLLLKTNAAFFVRHGAGRFGFSLILCSGNPNGRQSMSVSLEPPTKKRKVTRLTAPNRLRLEVLKLSQRKESFLNDFDPFCVSNDQVEAWWEIGEEREDDLVITEFNDMLFHYRLGWKNIEENNRIIVKLPDTMISYNIDTTWGQWEDRYYPETDNIDDAVYVHKVSYISVVTRYEDENYTPPIITQESLHALDQLQPLYRFLGSPLSRIVLEYLASPMRAF